MKTFHYLAVDEDGELVRGKNYATDEQALERSLRNLGLTLVTERESMGSSLSKYNTKRKVHPKHLIPFYSRFGQSLEVGLPITATLDENIQIVPSPMLRNVIQELKEALEEGNTLYSAMQQYPGVFTNLEISLISMGEESGVLPETLKELAKFLEWREDLKSTIRRASIYPIFVVVALGAVIALWVGYILPQMASLMKEMGVTLPAISRAVFALSDFIQAYWPWFFGTPPLLFFSLFVIKNTKKGALWFDRWFLSLPLAGPVAAEIAYTRLCRNFSLMMRTGMTINKIFDILCRGVLGNLYLEARLRHAHNYLQRGMKLSDAMERAGGFPLLLIGSVRSGETTGSLEEAFGRLAKFYDEGVDRTIKAAISAMGPILTVVLGGIFGVIILSILLPLYDVLGTSGMF